MGIQDQRGDAQGKDTGRDLRLHRQVGYGAQEPARGYRRHSAEGELTGTAASVGIYSQESTMGHCL